MMEISPKKMLKEGRRRKKMEVRRRKKMGVRRKKPKIPWMFKA